MMLEEEDAADEGEQPSAGLCGSEGLAAAVWVEGKSFGIAEAAAAELAIADEERDAGGIAFGEGAAVPRQLTSSRGTDLAEK